MQVGDEVREIPVSSRKDARDAVVAARSSANGWRQRTSYNRGQVLYRVAEKLELSRSRFAQLSGGAEFVDSVVDRWVWFAGWADKVSQLLGSVNDVAGPYLNLSEIDATGVVVLFLGDTNTAKPGADSLATFIEQVGPALVTGNSVVAVSSPESAGIVLEFADVLATADIPPGVVNLLTGPRAEVATALVTHADVNAVDLAGISAFGDVSHYEELAAQTLKRVVSPFRLPADRDRAALARMRSFTEVKTVWHSAGR